jgi:prolyl-tRNA editing enzyme YbaK/EbsC (Cys-tRNA(Pro) deacylase)
MVMQNKFKMHILARNQHSSDERPQKKEGFMGKISPSAQKVQNALIDLGVTSEVIEFTESTRTAKEAADRVGCQLGQIVKSMIFKGCESLNGILVLTSGSNRVDEEKISCYAEEAIIRADPDFVRETTGFAIGGVPPIGHLKDMETYFDEDLLLFDQVWAAAGTPNAVFALSPSELIRISKAKTVCVKPDR